jgi:hypothetical protein
LSADIAPGQGFRNGGGLNRQRLGNTETSDALGNGRANPEIEEGRNVENSVRVEEANSGCEFERAHVGKLPNSKSMVPRELPAQPSSKESFRGPRPDRAISKPIHQPSSPSMRCRRDSLRRSGMVRCAR